MVSEIAENIVIYDWCSFTTKCHTPDELISALGLTHVPWVESRGARGYKSKKYFSSINIHYDGRPDMGVWCEMSGQGCRTFETMSKLFLDGDGWKKLFQWIHENGCKLTRLDVAYDDHTGLLPIGRIVEDTQSGLWISKSDFWETVLSSKGTSVFIGSPQSKVRIRIYDKAAERNIPDQHWIRCELQLRDDRAQAFSELQFPIGEAFAGVVKNYLRYIIPDSDLNKWRWPMTDYWRSFRRGCREDKHLSGSWHGVQSGSVQTFCRGTGRECDSGSDRAVRDRRVPANGGRASSSSKPKIRMDDKAGTGKTHGFQVRGTCETDKAKSKNWKDRGFKFSYPRCNRDDHIYIEVDSLHIDLVLTCDFCGFRQHFEYLSRGFDFELYGTNG